MSHALRVEAAASRFRAFFQELSETFFEREDVLRQVALALLAREHALLTGPPGTAKSALAQAVFGRIICEETGEPSLYSRQITESTVQTDLIGPVDFKHLMETGRTAHFTDEGMLGAAHAFLDEVFDGRDMLLRSALNVLEERELKQGAKVTRGQIEVALMTSNRYIADVVDNARETLLAFIDRIAFVSFVPRGFANPENLQKVLARHVAGSKQKKLDALLTIQDVDVLQEVVDQVVISEPICKALALLLDRLDLELSDAVRADPAFVPTRYLSTRSAVKSGRLLRAIAVYDAIFERPDRSLQVLAHDLEWLRLHLLLSGPARDDLGVLLDRERDPQERRQLEILRTEREIFDRCLSSLPKIKVKKLPRERRLADPPPAPAPVSLRSPTATAKGEAKGEAKGTAKPPPSPLDGPRKAIAEGDVLAIVDAMAQLSRLVAEGGEPGVAANALLGEASLSLGHRVAEAALGATRLERDEDLLAGVERLVEVASQIQDDRVSLHEIAKRLRARALDVIDGIALYALGARSEDLTPLDSADEIMRRSERRLALFERLADHRRKVQPAAATAQAEDTGPWKRALDNLVDDLAAPWDGALCLRIERTLRAHPDASLVDVLGSVEAELERLEELETRLIALRGEGHSLKRLAFGRRLGDLVAALLRRSKLIDRKTLHDEIDGVLAILEKAKLSDCIGPSRWVALAAEALVGTQKPRAEPAIDVYDHDGYRRLRDEEHQVPLAYALSEVVLRVSRDAKSDGLRAVATALAALPGPLVSRIAEAESSRLERLADYLEGWWQSLLSDQLPVDRRLERIVKSRFFEAIWDESALARTALEADLLAEILPQTQDACASLEDRLLRLEASSRKAAQALLQERSDAAWARAVGGAGD